MEFWGVEVKAGETVKCEPGEDRLLHLSQAALGETKGKGAENVPIYVKIDDQKLVLGTLSAEKCAQISYDLVFEKEFELSHGSKNTSVYFAGYKTELPEDDEFPGDSGDSESEEDVPVAQNANGALKVKSQEEKPAKVEEKPAKAKSNVNKEDNAAAKSKAKAGKLVKAEPDTDNADDKDDSDSEEDDDDDSDESDDDVDMMEALGDSDDDDEDSDEEDDDDDNEDDESSEEEDEETPKKSASGKKRPAEAVSKTSAPEKKAKLTTPASGQKTVGDGKKGTPGKQSGKAQANNDKSKPQTPKSAGSVSCKSCSKSFNSESALESHTKAKHSGAK